LSIESEPEPARSARRVVAQLLRFERERIAFSPADLRCRAEVAALLTAAGLEVEIDPAFNVLGRLAGREELAPLLIGSHLDTVRDPGRYDGTLGVLSGIEVARTLASSPVGLRRPLIVAAFSDEEGSATLGCWGARARLGLLSAEERRALADPSSPLHQLLSDAAQDMARLGWEVDPFAPLDDELAVAAAYLELHVEQGPLLERSGDATAAVTSIVGIARYEVVVHGVRGHAGTVPMADRDDAVVRASRLVARYWDHLLSLGGEAVGNFGRIIVSPGGFNVIPGEVRVAVEVRSPQWELLADLEAELLAMAASVGGEVEVVGRDAPVALSPEIVGQILAGAEDVGVSCSTLPSWAGHDAAMFAARVPTGMIFVPSVGGVSHCPDELTREADVASGIGLLLAAVRRLDSLTLEREVSRAG
jgi:N-carbamoyl-L-amino-acid hydrolase